MAHLAALKTILLASALAASGPAAADPVDDWRSEIKEASSRFDLPERWIRRVIWAESGGRALSGDRPIVSRAGAMGLMQLMPGTWLEMKGSLGLGSDPFNPRDNILAGSAYLRMMYERFGYPGLFAAYNAGPRRYAAYLSGTRPLPPETKAYVRSIANEDGVAPIGFRSPAPLFALRPPADIGGKTISTRASSQGLFVRLEDHEP